MQAQGLRCFPLSVGLSVGGYSGFKFLSSTVLLQLWSLKIPGFRLKEMIQNLKYLTM